MPTRLRNLLCRGRRLRDDCRGSAAVEFGFAMPILILFTVGLIDLSMLLWLSSTIENAAAEGARFAIVNGAGAPTPASATDVENFIRTQAVGVPATALNVDVTWQPSNQSGSRVTVALAYTLISWSAASRAGSGDHQQDLADDNFLGFSTATAPAGSQTPLFGSPPSLIFRSHHPTGTVSICRVPTSTN